MTHTIFVNFFIPDITSIILSYNSNGRVGECNDVATLPSDYTLSDFVKESSDGNTRLLAILTEKEECKVSWLLVIGI